jgi:hypothetical protein
MNGSPAAPVMETQAQAMQVTRTDEGAVQTQQSQTQLRWGR